LKSLEIMKITLGEMNIDYTNLLENISSSYGNKGDHDKALEYVFKSL